jgi:D-serine deaminase-like pyridoxal phosphate-dependent protein
MIESNIREMTETAMQAEAKLWPHVKIYQCPGIAKMQINAGACGVEVGNVEQAAVMANDGIDNIVIAHPFMGEKKIEKLKELLSKPGLSLKIVVDMVEQVQVLSQVGRELNKKIPVLVKIDTGINRYGVLPGEPALNLASELSRNFSIELAAIYAHQSDEELADHFSNTLVKTFFYMITEC